jgi:hypothetical protein
MGQSEVEPLKRDEDSALEFTKMSGKRYQLGADRFNRHRVLANATKPHTTH